MEILRLSAAPPLNNTVILVQMKLALVQELFPHPSVATILILIHLRIFPQKILENSHSNANQRGYLSIGIRYLHPHNTEGHLNPLITAEQKG